jgi:hypothetical protein
MKTVEDQVRPGESLLQVLEKLPVIAGTPSNASLHRTLVKP